MVLWFGILTELTWDHNLSLVISSCKFLLFTPSFALFNGWCQMYRLRSYHCLPPQHLFEWRRVIHFREPIETLFGWLLPTRSAEATVRQRRLKDILNHCIFSHWLYLCLEQNTLEMWFICGPGGSGRPTLSRCQSRHMIIDISGNFRLTNSRPQTSPPTGGVLILRKPQTYLAFFSALDISRAGIGVASKASPTQNSTT